MLALSTFPWFSSQLPSPNPRRLPGHLPTNHPAAYPLACCLQELLLALSNFPAASPPKPRAGSTTAPLPTPLPAAAPGGGADFLIGRVVDTMSKEVKSEEGLLRYLGMVMALKESPYFAVIPTATRVRLQVLGDVPLLIVKLCQSRVPAPGLVADVHGDCTEMAALCWYSTHTCALFDGAGGDTVLPALLQSCSLPLRAFLPLSYPSLCTALRLPHHHPQPHKHPPLSTLQTAGRALQPHAVRRPPLCPPLRQ